MTILVVDDDLDILTALQDLLELEGYTVITTPRADQTFKTVRSYRPDVIILDVLLSGADGRTIAAQLRQQKKTQRIPIIMISAHPSARRSAKACGANAFMAKPFEMEELLQLLQRYA